MEMLAQWRGYDWGMGPGMMGWAYGTSWLGHVIMLTFWIAVIIGIVFLIRWVIVSAKAGSPPPPHGDSALDILRKRYARGEINKAEFEEKKRDLLA